MKRLIDVAAELTGAKPGLPLASSFSQRGSPIRHGEKDTAELITTDGALDQLADELIEAEKQGQAMSSATAKANKKWGQW